MDRGEFDVQCGKAAQQKGRFVRESTVAGGSVCGFADRYVSHARSSRRWTGRVDVPTGYAVYPYELLQTPRVWAEGRYNLVHYSVQDRGGHFAAFEQPHLFAADVNAYGDKLRELGIF